MPPETITCPTCTRAALLDPETDAMVHLDATLDSACAETATKEALLRHLENPQQRHIRHLMPVPSMSGTHR